MIFTKMFTVPCTRTHVHILKENLQLILDENWLVQKIWDIQKQQFVKRKVFFGDLHSIASAISVDFHAELSPWLLCILSAERQIVNKL